MALKRPQSCEEIRFALLALKRVRFSTLKINFQNGLKVGFASPLMAKKWVCSAFRWVFGWVRKSPLF